MRWWIAGIAGIVGIEIAGIEIAGIALIGVPHLTDTHIILLLLLPASEEQANAQDGGGNHQEPHKHTQNNHGSVVRHGSITVDLS